MQKEELQRRYDELEAEKATLNLNSTDDKWRLTVIEQQQREIREQLNGFEQEERIQATVQSSASGLDEIVIEGLPFIALFAGTDYYELAKIELEQRFKAQADQFAEMLAEQKEEYKEKLKGADEELLQVRRQNDNLQRDLNVKIEQAARLLDEKEELQAENEDLHSKLKNAAAQIEEKDAIIAQKEGHIDDLRKQVALGVRGAINVVDTEEQDRKKKELAIRIKLDRTVYDEQGDHPINPRNYTAKKAINDEPVSYSWMVKKSYTVLTTMEEVRAFRLEHQIAIPEQAGPDSNGETPVQVDNGGVQEDIPVSVELPEVPTLPEATFPTQEDVQAGQREMGGDTAEAEMAGEAVSREELQALERRVIALEQRAGIRVA